MRVKLHFSGFDVWLFDVKCSVWRSVIICHMRIILPSIWISFLSPCSRCTRLHAVVFGKNKTLTERSFISSASNVERGQLNSKLNGIIYSCIFTNQKDFTFKFMARTKSILMCICTSDCQSHALNVFSWAFRIKVVFAISHWYLI